MENKFYYVLISFPADLNIYKKSDNWLVKRTQFGFNAMIGFDHEPRSPSVPTRPTDHLAT